MENVKISLAKYIEEYKKNLEKFENENIINRIWEKDFTVWRESPEEISNRLGWLDCADVAKTKYDEINNFVNEIRRDEFTDVLLLGMGGSSLAPEVYRKVFGVKSGYLDLSILDSTHPDQVDRMLQKYKDRKTLFVVSTKSGGTVETISFMKRFYNTTLSLYGEEEVGKRFIAITDPGSGLEKIARELNFRKIFLNDPNIGGRYSALSLFGIVPAALIGVDLEELFFRVNKTMENSKKSLNNISKIGVALGVLANKGVDKVTYLLSNNIEAFGAWAEQLIAESTGKDGKGILPVVGEEIINVSRYSKDRVFVNIRLENDLSKTEFVKEISAEGFPVIEISVKDIYELGAQFFAWEMITVIASREINIQPFDQPNVEQAKVIARKMMSDYFESGKLATLQPSLEMEGIKVYGEINAEQLSEVIPNFLSKMNKGENEISGRSYVSIQAYVDMNEQAEEILQEMRTKIETEYSIATTIGFGPRFLHSTGQLHKGDAGNGLFIQIVSKNITDIDIPDEVGSDKSSISFNVLINAQALGDRAALIENKREVIRFDINSINEIKKII